MESRRKHDNLLPSVLPVCVPLCVDVRVHACAFAWVCACVRACVYPLRPEEELCHFPFLFIIFSRLRRQVLRACPSPGLSIPSLLSFEDPPRFFRSICSFSLFPISPQPLASPPRLSSHFDCMYLSSESSD